MSLRQKITIWLLPTLIPVIIVIFFNYRSQRDAETNYYLKMVSLAVQNGAREINTYLRLKNNSFHLIYDGLLHYVEKTNSSNSTGYDTHLSVLMKENPGFSIIALTNPSGVIASYHGATNSINNHLLPRDITGLSLLTSEMLEKLNRLFSTWKSKHSAIMDRLQKLQQELLLLSARGEKNSKRYREVHEELITVRLISLHSPITIFEGDSDLAVSAGLPFRSSTLLFAVPYSDSNMVLKGFVVGVLDWSVIEDKCFVYKEGIHFGGIPNADIHLLTATPLPSPTGSNTLELKESLSDKNVRVVYDLSKKEYLTSASLLTAANLNSSNHMGLQGHLQAGQASYEQDEWQSKGGYFVAVIPEHDLEAHSNVLLARAVKVLFFSIILLLGVIFFLTDRIVSPIKRLATLATSLGDGENHERIKTSQQDEIGHLVKAFNSMCDKVHDAKSSLEEKNNQLSSAKERYRLLFDNAPIAIAVSNHLGKIVEVNRAAIQLSGYTSKELLEVNAASFYKNPDDREKLLQDLAKGEIVEARENDLLTQNGGQLRCKFTSIQLNIDSVKYIYTMFEDISYQKEVELEKELIADQLHRARKMEVIGLMASGVAHDLNNTLTGLVSYPDLLLQTLPPDSNLRKPIKTIKESGERASAIVADLLTVARGAASVKKTISLDNLIREYLQSPEANELIALYPSVKIEYDCRQSEVLINCSEIHIKKALMNLITNGVEAVSENGLVKITLDVHSLNGEKAKKLRLCNGNYVALAVCDNGPGISELNQKHIFEPFYTKKEMGQSGTGLGLTIVWNSVQDHDGGIDVESDKHQTCFSLYFPVVSHSDGALTHVKNDSIPQGNREHILVVDDEEVPREIARKILEYNGYQVSSVSSGKEALTFLSHNIVDLVILDMLMPPGMNGYLTYKKLLELNPGQKAIIASGFSEDKDVQNALDLGASGLLKKPYTVEKLCRMVRSTLSA